ncbi:MAG TPA: beta-ketoacyl-ACP synthase II [Planctomycetaceae bacterium]|nr:beta-ketoacyl-ACP synthase II [Planctomycetaceae bacterium]HQZ67273.1 beta-ketoacyl-ACP synthase II [Planctomycetaceae bacterium]
MSRRRVVVTGLGVVTPLGCDLDDVWEAVCAGKSGIGPVQRFDCREFKVRFGGEIRNFKASDHIQFDAKDERRIDRFCQFALIAADRAIRQAAIDFNSGDSYRYGVLVGSGIGGLDEIESQHSMLFDRGPDRISPFMIPKLIINAASGNISVRWGLRGPNSAVCTACASGTNAIGDASRLIQMDVADVMITGGTEAGLTPMGIAGFARTGALSTRNDAPQQASRPFDRDRDGFVLSEGAGILVLEEREFAMKRGATILAEVLGYGQSADATHLTAPNPRGAGAAYAMSAALRNAGVRPDEVDYINAHGTSTLLGDIAETNAIRTVFGSHADALAVSSTKSQLGHLMGASGGVESAFCVTALLRQIAPPTINLDEPDPGCDLDYIPDKPRGMRIRKTMKNSFGFGGHNACLVFGEA